jgi:beta-lactam-binding protein with PASTA domain
MPSKLLRGLGFLAYLALLFVIFGLAAYTSFSVFVRSGATTVPTVVGLSRTDAANLLADHGLVPREPNDDKDKGKETGRYDDEIPAGRVARQNPDPRTLVKRGSPVTIFLSLGPRRVAVPDLRGKTLPGAQAAISGTGLALGRILGALAPNHEAPGSVLEQDPDNGTAVAPATGVDLLLAMGTPSARYVMPDLVYRNYDQVRPYFEQLGFKFGSVKFERYEGVAAGVILRQFPLPGHPLSHDDSVSVVVATAEGVSSATPAAPASPATPEGVP